MARRVRPPAGEDGMPPGLLVFDPDAWESSDRWRAARVAWLQAHGSTLEVLAELRVKVAEKREESAS